MIFTTVISLPTMSNNNDNSQIAKQASPEKIRVSFPNPFRKTTQYNNTNLQSPRKRVGFEDEILKKNRKTVDNVFRRVGSLMGKDLSLNSDGIGYFSHGKFVVVIEVPECMSGNFCIYTLVCRAGPSDNLALVLHRAMELNYMGFGTRGSTLGLEGEEVNLCYSGPIVALTVDKLHSIIDAFLLTASEVNIQLEAAKHHKFPI